MTDINKKQNNKIDKAIKSLIKEINEKPFIYRNEADIQARLYYYLCYELEEWQPIHETGFKGLKTNLVHREYFGGRGQRVDLVVFDKKDIENICMNSMEKSHSCEYVKVTDAIEIKTEQGSTGKNRLDRILKDINKLIKLRDEEKADYLYFIYIIRWPTKVKSKHKEIKDIVKKAHQKCIVNNISFYTNRKDNYFLLNQDLRVQNEKTKN